MIRISKAADTFMRENGIEDVTFNLIEVGVSGCCVGIVKEIEPVYRIPQDASGYRYFHVDGRHIFVARKIRLAEALTLTTERLWKKRLYLSGATVPI